jgi:hypothetical protein
MEQVNIFFIIIIIIITFIQGIYNSIKQSRNRPGGVAQSVPGGLGSRIS